MNLKTIVATLSVVASCGVVASATASSAAVSGTHADPKSEPDRSRRVCRSLPPTGSRLPDRVCRTQREWDEIADRTRNNIEGGQRDGSLIPDPRTSPQN